jgi:DNA-binding transcriptional MocR family regulator
VPEAQADLNRTTLYQEVAARIEGLIEGGTLRPGDRVPSVRRLASQLGVSISTVLEAYRLLEDQRLIEARPKSGYYVRRRRAELPSPARTTTGEAPSCCDCRPVVLKVLSEAHQPGLVSLGAACPDPGFFPTARLARAMARAVREAPEASQTYASVEGHEALRVQVARRLLDAGCSVTPDEVTITNGAQESVVLALRALTRPGDTVVVETPTYYGLLEAIGSLHLKALEIATDPRDGICLTELDQALDRGGVRAVVLGPTHGNPLGHCMPDEARRRLVELLEEHDVHLVEDDVYGELSFSGRRPKAIKAFDAGSRVLLCSSFSKTLAPGYRVGWIVAGCHRERIETLKFSTNVATATPTQLGVAEFLGSGGFDRYLGRLRRTYRDLVQRMTGAVIEHFPEGTAVTRPQGGHVLWVELPGGVDSVALHAEAVRHGVSFAPGPMFSPSQRYRSFLRLNCAVPWTDRVEEAVRRLGGLLQASARG